jgi:hypothetical protein
MTTITAERLADAQEQIRRLRAPWRDVDDTDWDYIADRIGDSGRARFWKAVWTEMRAALVEPKP